MGRGSPSVTQSLVQAGGAQVWRAGALHPVCLQDGKEEAQLSVGRAGLVCPGWVQGPAPLAKMALNSLSKPTCWDNRGPHGACPLRCTHTPAWQPGSGWTQPCGTDGLVPHLSLGQLPPGPPVGPALLPLCGCEDPGGQGPGWAILILGYVGQGTAGGGGKLCVQPCNLHSRGHS